MISLLLIVLTAVVVDVELTDGQQLTGEFAGLSEEGIALVAAEDGRQRTYSRSGLTKVTFPTAKEVMAPTVVIQLTDDSVIPCDSVLLTDGKLQIINGKSTWSAPEAAIRAIRWRQPQEKTEVQWNEVLDRSGTDDLLVIRRESSLDYLKGVVKGVTKDAIQFEYADDTIPVPFDRAAGFILARQGQEQPNARIQLSTNDGAHWMLRSAISNKNEIELTSMANVQRTISIEELKTIQFPQLGAVYLSDLEPTSIDYQPYIGSLLNDALKKLGAPQFDRSGDGLVLRLADSSSATGWKMYRRGLSIRSRTEMIYRLAGKYQRFQAVAGIDPVAPSQANVQLTLFADDREIYNSPIRKVDTQHLIDVDVQNTRRLKIVVDYGANIHIGDRLHLCDARLTK